MGLCLPANLRKTVHNAGVRKLGWPCHESIDFHERHWDYEGLREWISHASLVRCRGTMKLHYLSEENYKCAWVRGTLGNGNSVRPPFYLRANGVGNSSFRFLRGPATPIICRMPHHWTGNKNMAQSGVISINWRVIFSFIVLEWWLSELGSDVGQQVHLGSRFSGVWGDVPKCSF